MEREKLAIDIYDIDTEAILENKLALPLKITGIYFLIESNENEIVYIGQSLDIMSRIMQHQRDILKDFDAFSILECSPEFLSTLEAHFIYKFHPRLNRSFPVNRIYKSLEQIKKIYDVNTLLLKRWMKYKSIEFDKNNLYRLSDFDEINNFKKWMNKNYPNVYLKQCSVEYLKRYIKETDINTSF